MQLCKKCNRKFPDHLISPLVTNEGRFPMCPLCALKHRNAAVGLPEDTPFQGEQAQAMWEEATALIAKRKVKKH